MYNISVKLCNLHLFDEGIIMIEITALNKIYKSHKRKKCHALKDINLTLPDTGFVFVLGKSGSGKSTLLNLIGGLDNITSGRIVVDGNDLSRFSERKFCNYRNSHIGFIFQDYHLIDELTVGENIRLSMDLVNVKGKNLIKEALEKVDLAGYEDRYPTELSGGEQQRVAIARAIVKNPRIILADEPTGNLDTNTTTAIVELLKELSKERLILVVSHNVGDANRYADRIIELSNGEVLSDVSRNPDFTDALSLAGEKLVYPQGATLSDEDVALINGNREAEFVIRSDKFLPSQPAQVDDQKIRIRGIRLRLGRKLNLSGKFLKKKVMTIPVCAFMVAVIMVIMALAQTIVAFDGGEIVKREMENQNYDTIYITKELDRVQQSWIASLGVLSTCFPEVEESDIQKFRDTDYQGKIYEVLKYDLHIQQSTVSAGASRNIFTNSPYILEGIGTMIVDEAFFEDKFGEVTYLAKAEEFHPTGVIITDYLADAIMLSGNVPYATDYDKLIGEYRWGTDSVTNSISRGYINGIIKTGYDDTYAELFDMIENEEFDSLNDMLENEDFCNFVEDIYNGLGFCYTLNPDFRQDALTDPAWDMLWHYSLAFNGGAAVYNANAPQVRKASLYGIDLGENEIMMNMERYNEFLGGDYTAETIDEFKPHTVRLSHYMNFDHSEDLFTQRFKIVGLFEGGRNSIGGTFLVGDGVYELFQQDFIYTTGLYLDGSGNIDSVIDLADELGYEMNLAIVEGIHTMTKAVDMFIPIFELIAIVLCVGVVFILMSFSTKMIRGKMHEIGILKALGTKNGAIGVVFGLQVALIAVMTCALSTVGYYYIVGFANRVLIGSLQRLAPSSVVLDLDFLVFQPDIAAANCILTAILSVIALIVPMIKIKTIKPVRIIKARE